MKGNQSTQFIQPQAIHATQTKVQATKVKAANKVITSITNNNNNNNVRKGQEVNRFAHVARCK